MSMFSRQPDLPPERPSAPAAASAVPPGIATPQPMGHFAIVGVDTQTGQPTSTVIEARSENEAQQIAQQHGIIVDEFKPMHPLAGAAAAKLARDDPNDRFNRPGHLHEQTRSTVGSHAAHDDDYLSPRLPLADMSTWDRGAAPQKRTASGGPLGTLAVVAVLLAVGGLVYNSVLRDGGLQQVVASMLPQPAAVEAAFDVTEPLGVDLSQIEGFGFEEWTPDQRVTDLPGPANGRLFLQATVPPTANSRHPGSAVISGRLIQPGQTIAGYRLIRVFDKHVLLQNGRKLVALRMPKNTP
ncbi:MAG: hypothetical protein AAGG38_07925 [Planctomycetota bacterium]